MCYTVTSSRNMNKFYIAKAMQQQNIKLLYTKGSHPNLTAIANPSKLVFASTISSFAALHRLSFSSLAPFSRFQIKNKTFDYLATNLEYLNPTHKTQEVPQ